MLNITLQIDELKALLIAAGSDFRTTSLDQLFALGSPQYSSLKQAPEAVLGRALGISEEESPKLAVASYTALADGIDLNGDYCMRADPVSLVAATSKVFLMGAAGYGLTDQERQSLEQSFNQQFAGDGLQFCFPNNQRWYIRLRSGLGVANLLPPPRALLGEDISAAISQLDGYWQRSFTEAQMLLHADPIRLQREQSGTPPLSGLWFWGGGKLEKLNLTKDNKAVACSGNSPLLQGLALTTAATWQPQPQINAASRQVIHWRAEQPGSAMEQLTKLEELVFSPLLEAVTIGATLHLHSSDAGSWRLQKSFRWPWRRQLTAHTEMPS